MKWIAPTDLPLVEGLAKLFPDSSGNQLRRFVESGRVSINQVEVKKVNLWLKKGDEIKVASKKQNLSHGLKILFQDNDLIVIEKPENLLSVATLYDEEMTAHAILKKYLKPKRVYPVHRLDRETSGIMMFACSETARDALKEQLARHSVEREYVALVHGIFESKQGSWESYLVEDKNYYVRSNSAGQYAKTHYTVLSERGARSLIRLQLETGRKNQIRVHCSEAGHPVFGDKKYSDKKDCSKRLFLHAIKLRFTHPISKKEMLFESALPLEFHHAIKTLN